MFEVTTAVQKMLQLTARKKVIQGATSSGKTYGIIPIIYDKCIETPALKCTVVAESIPAVKDGAVDIFKSFLMDEGRWHDQRWIANPMEYTLPNRGKIQFKSFDSVGKAKAAGKRDLLFLNEANHIPYEIADALMIRSKEIWLDFNADRKFWAHSEILSEPNSEFLKLTYEDNESIPAETLEDLLIRREKAMKEDREGRRGFWWNWWQVYGLGEIGIQQGAVWSDWSVVDEVPANAEFLGFGLDFGFSNSYTACIAVHQMDGKYYFDEWIYDIKLTNQDIAEMMISMGYAGEMVYCDSAEPKSIEELRRLEINAFPCASKSDIREYGISKIAQNHFFVTKSSTGMIGNLQNYIWAVDKTGEPLNKPKKDNDHAPDAIIYFIGTQDKYDGRY